MTAPDAIRTVLWDEDDYLKSADGASDFNVRLASVKKRLEVEFGLPFQDVSIGRGAEGTGFLAVLALVASGSFALLIAGKKIEESLEAYSRIYRKYIKPFLKRKFFVCRNGALLMVMNELFERTGNEPKSVQWLGYKCLRFLQDDEPENLNSIEPAGDDLAGNEVHYFELEVDGKRVKATVFNTEVRLRTEGQSHPILPNTFPD